MTAHGSDRSGPGSLSISNQGKGTEKMVLLTSSGVLAQL